PDVGALAKGQVTVGEDPAGLAVEPRLVGMVAQQPLVRGRPHRDRPDRGVERLEAEWVRGVTGVAGEQPVEGVVVGGDEAVDAGSGEVSGAGHPPSVDVTPDTCATTRSTRPGSSQSN